MNQNQPRAVSLSDLGQLPMRSNVAFAVRCAQRLRPCFRLTAQAPRGREQVAAVDAAIGAATAFCSGLPLEPGHAAAAARKASAVAEATYEFTSYAGFAAVRAAHAAACAEAVVGKAPDMDVTEVVAAAFGAARVIAANVDANALDLVVAALYEDVQKLLALARTGVGELGAPVDPAESGPLGALWPAGAPLCFAQGPRADEV